MGRSRPCIRKSERCSQCNRLIGSQITDRISALVVRPRLTWLVQEDHRQHRVSARLRLRDPVPSLRNRPRSVDYQQRACTKQVHLASWKPRCNGCHDQSDEEAPAFSPNVVAYLVVAACDTNLLQDRDQVLAYQVLASSAPVHFRVGRWQN